MKYGGDLIPRTEDDDGINDGTEGRTDDDDGGGDDGTDGRTEDDDGDDGKDTTGRTDDIYIYIYIHEFLFSKKN